MASTSPSPTRCQFSLDQTCRRLSMYGVQKSWDAFHQSSNRQNDDLLSLCEGTVSSFLRLSCILSFLVCLSDSVSVSLLYLLSCFRLGSVAYYSRKRADGLCSRTLICESRLSGLGSAGFPTFYYPCKSVLVSYLYSTISE